jgi:hypothetical protein
VKYKIYDKFNKNKSIMQVDSEKEIDQQKSYYDSKTGEIQVWYKNTIQEFEVTFSYFFQSKNYLKNKVAKMRRLISD